MEERGTSLAQIADVPTGSLVLLAGPPGAGKSTFCQRVVLNALAMERPVIFVTTERGPAEVARLLGEDGMGEPPPGALAFVDAFGETVGLATSDLPGTVGANCQDLNSISMALARLQQRTGRKGVLLAFDSLTSPYLFNREEVLRFARLSLGRFAAEGNAVVALMDEGCGKEEDLGAMMSIADGILRMEIEESSRVMSVVKHPTVRPTRIEVPMQPERPGVKASLRPDPRALRQFAQSFFAGGDAKALRSEVGDFVNLFWPNLAHWSGILWDPKGFPTMIYQLNKEDAAMIRELREDREALEVLPWPMRLAYKAMFGLQGLGLFFPKDLSSVEDMGKLAGGRVPSYFKYIQAENSGALEYLESVSRTDEHTFRMYESSDCSGFEDVGATMASHIPPAIAGECKGLELEERDWNAIETKCIGLGDPYCEFKLVPGPIDELRSSLQKDARVVERIHHRLMDRLTEFLLDGKPLVDRPRLGSDVHVHVVMHAMGFPHIAGERYRMAQRMGGAKSGKEIGRRLVDAGLSRDEAISRVIGFMNHCKVGKVTLRPGPSAPVGTGSGQAPGETIRIGENCESLRTKLFTTTDEPSCYFTTGFLNGLFSAVRNQHVREIKCITAGDPYCEWEII